MRRRESWFRGALSSVLFFALLVGGTPGVGLADDDPEDWGLGELLAVVRNQVPVPRLQITIPPSSPVRGEGGIGPIGHEIGIATEAAREVMLRSVKATLRQMAHQAGHTPEGVCGWYDRNHRSQGASGVRMGIALGAFVYMYWDLRDSEGKLSIKEAELQKQLGGLLALIVAGGGGDSIVRDVCNAAGSPIPIEPAERQSGDR